MQAQVLVVDDHPNHRRLLLSAAQARGFRLLEPCSSSQEAIAACSQHRPEVVVLDLHLQGGFDGFALCELVRDICPQARIVVSSSFAESDLMERVFAAGAHRCLRKPFRMDEALRLFEHLAVELETQPIS